MRGYGLADRERRIPVDPERTLFRVASLSKTLTAAAAMRLVEEGRLSLGQDLRPLLRLRQLEEDGGGPLTLEQLLTHTAGFDEVSVGLTAVDSADQARLSENLERLLPRRTLRPGSFYSYSNVGFALAGLAVERTAGEPFERAVRRLILGPAGMDSSFFDLPADQEDRVARGYYTDGPEPEPAGTFLWRDAPAGALVTSAPDMARFLRMLLSGGTLEGRRILSPSSVRAMLSVRFTPDPLVDGSGLAFYRRSVNGRVAFEHAGDMDGFGSLLFLLPEERFGLFVSANTDDSDFRDALIGAILNRYWPAPSPPPLEPPGRILAWERDLPRYWRHGRTARASAEKAAEWGQEATELRIDPEGLLVLSPPESWNEPEGRYVPLGPDRFRELDGTRGLVLRRDGAGRAVSLTVGEVYETYEPIPFPERPDVQRGAALLFALAGGGSVFAWGLRPLARRLRGRIRGTGGGGLPSLPGPRALLALFWILAGLFVGFLALWDRGGGSLDRGYPTLFRAVFLLPHLAGGVWGLALLRWMWRPGGIGRTGGTGRENLAVGASLAAGLLFLLDLSLWRVLGLPG